MNGSDKTLIFKVDQYQVIEENQVRTIKINFLEPYKINQEYSGVYLPLNLIEQNTPSSSSNWLTDDNITFILRNQKYEASVTKDKEENIYLGNIIGARTDLTNLNNLNELAKKHEKKQTNLKEIKPLQDFSQQIEVEISRYTILPLALGQHPNNHWGMLVLEKEIQGTKINKVYWTSAKNNLSEEVSQVKALVAFLTSAEIADNIDITTLDGEKQVREEDSGIYLCLYIKEILEYQTRTKKAFGEPLALTRNYEFYGTPSSPETEETKPKKQTKTIGDWSKSGEITNEEYLYLLGSMDIWITAQYTLEELKNKFNEIKKNKNSESEKSESEESSSDDESGSEDGQDGTASRDPLAEQEPLPPLFSTPPLSPLPSRPSTPVLTLKADWNQILQEIYNFFNINWTRTLEEIQNKAQQILDTYGDPLAGLDLNGANPTELTPSKIGQDAIAKTELETIKGLGERFSKYTVLKAGMDGNCYLNSFSILLSGEDYKWAVPLRVKLCLELMSNKKLSLGFTDQEKAAWITDKMLRDKGVEDYPNDPNIVFPLAKDKTYMPLDDLSYFAYFLHRPVVLIYPAQGVATNNPDAIQSGGFLWTKYPSVDLEGLNIWFKEPFFIYRLKDIQHYVPLVRPQDHKEGIISFKLKEYEFDDGSPTENPPYDSRKIELTAHGTFKNDFVFDTSVLDNLSKIIIYLGENNDWTANRYQNLKDKFTGGASKIGKNIYISIVNTDSNIKIENNELRITSNIFEDIEIEKTTDLNLLVIKLTFTEPLRVENDVEENLLFTLDTNQEFKSEGLGADMLLDNGTITHKIVLPATDEDEAKNIASNFTNKGDSKIITYTIEGTAEVLESYDLMGSNINTLKLNKGVTITPSLRDKAFPKPNDLETKRELIIKEISNKMDKYGKHILFIDPLFNKFAGDYNEEYATGKPGKGHWGNDRPDTWLEFINQAKDEAELKITGDSIFYALGEFFINYFLGDEGFGEIDAERLKTYLADHNEDTKVNSLFTRNNIEPRINKLLKAKKNDIWEVFFEARKISDKNTILIDVVFKDINKKEFYKLDDISDTNTFDIKKIPFELENELGDKTLKRVYFDNLNSSKEEEIRNQGTPPNDDFRAFWSIKGSATYDEGLSALHFIKPDNLEYKVSLVMEPKEVNFTVLRRLILKTNYVSYEVQPFDMFTDKTNSFKVNIKTISFLINKYKENDIFLEKWIDNSANKMFSFRYKQAQAELAALNNEELVFSDVLKVENLATNEEFIPAKIA
ncbi:hypothetical protein [endosymbiont GvMRE of Glomus versiforme]|uniref:hypothetical protein n=1 Tax=endosymbiont GvMRE of Glomus versiforme TaxID=2039283 RepID=UPI000ECBF89B|nr:hypothetical protein [endosymbiont GvMRE of Glomus versiforme]RHZ37154.1 hypothetical protein GvMRE_I1g498 [endosymbiont GvMRE of Glomus versiforme]